MTSPDIPPNWDDPLYLSNNPDVAAALGADDPVEYRSGYDHFVRYGLLEGRPPCWRQKHVSNVHDSDPEMLQTQSERLGVPLWIVRESAEQARFDPALDCETLPALPTYNPLNKQAWGELLRDACRDLRHCEYDYLFFLPWLKRGGADLVSIHHIRAAAEIGAKIAVALTEDAQSEWLDKLPPQVDVIHFGKFVASLPLDFQGACCYLLAVGVSARRVHVINSHAAWNFLTRNAAALASVCKVYVSLFCYDFDKTGEPVGYARNVRRCAAHIDKIFTDNSEFAAHLIDSIGVARNKLVVLRYPVGECADMPRPALHSRHVLWASRLDTQKRPELLLKIAKRMPQLHFDVFGSAVLDHGRTKSIITEMESYDNITYRGPFDSVRQILAGSYRFFLYTSAWDGLPNILLEVMYAGMLVVSGNVGGIGSDLGDSNLILASDHSSVESYVSAIKFVYQNPELAENVRRKGQEFVTANHTFSRFTITLRTSGYLDPSTKVRSPSPPFDDRRNGLATSGTEVLELATGIAGRDADRPRGKRSMPTAEATFSKRNLRLKSR